MSKPIRITMRSFQDHGADAPEVWDFVYQIEDIIRMLESIETNVIVGADGPTRKQDPQRMLAWRITGLSKRSPCNVELTPFAKPYQAHIDHTKLANNVMHVTARGLQCFATEQGEPADFPVVAVNSLRAVYERVLNGLGETTIDFSDYGELPAFRANRDNAQRGIAAVEAVTAPPQKELGHRELGSVEGFVTGIRRNSRGHPVLYMRTRLDNNEVKCVFSDNDPGKFGQIDVEHLVSNMRIAVSGLIKYDKPMHIKEIVIDHIYVYRPDGQLPNARDMVIRNFTEGRDVVELVKEARKND